MLNKIKNILLYTGVDKNSYKLVQNDINNINRKMISIFTGLATILVGIMCVISLFLNGTLQNHFVYLGGFFAALVLFLLSTFYGKNHPWIIVFLIYFAYSIFLIYGIAIGTITNPTQQTVTFMVMLVILPILFIDHPLRMAMVMLFYVIVFIILCCKRKTGVVFTIDILDAIIYAILGFASGTIVNHNKIRKFILEHILEEATRIDQLTHMNNRNSFETDLRKIPDVCNEMLACVYVDVNGLHELNNVRGHLMGDIMLQYIAENMIKVFGKDYTYRIGGDEFVAFIVDKDEVSIESSINRFIEAVEREEYHVAIGVKNMAKNELDMDMIIRTAETIMYQNKAAFYQDSQRDRRRR